jgi:hypothetical protein
MGVTEPDSTYPLALLPFQQPGARPRRGAVPCVLLIAGSDLSIELAQTVLWRFDLVRVSCPDPRNGLGIAAALAPDLIVVGALRTATTLALVRSLRRQVRGAPAIVVVARSVSRSALENLAGAGATVWDHPVDPRRWDDLLREILGMPTRRDLRVAVRLPVWWRRPAGPEAAAGLALDLSARGMFLESRSPLAIGSRLDLAFRLPQDDLAVHVVGQVVREVPSGNALRYGVAFLALSDQARDRIAAFVDSERPVGSKSPGSAHG